MAALRRLPRGGCFEDAAWRRLLRGGWSEEAASRKVLRQTLNTKLKVNQGVRFNQMYYARTATQTPDLQQITGIDPRRGPDRWISSVGRVFETLSVVLLNLCFQRYDAMRLLVDVAAQVRFSGGSWSLWEGIRGRASAWIYDS